MSKSTAIVIIFDASTLVGYRQQPILIPKRNNHWARKHTDKQNTKMSERRSPTDQIREWITTSGPKIKIEYVIDRLHRPEETSLYPSPS